MHQYDIEASIKNAINNFTLQLGWINESWRVNNIRPSGESAWFDNVELVTKRVTAVIGSYSFEFLAVVESPMECVLYMDTRTANLVTELKLGELRKYVDRSLKEHLAVYPHNMGM